MAVSEPGVRSHSHPRCLALCTQGQVSGPKEKSWLVLWLFEQKLEEDFAEASHCCLGMRLVPAWDIQWQCYSCACAWPWVVDWFLDLMPDVLLWTCLVVWDLASHSMVKLATWVISLLLPDLSPFLAHSSNFSIEQLTLTAFWHEGPGSTIVNPDRTQL